MLSSNIGERMYRSERYEQLQFPSFSLPFAEHLDPRNRWVVLAKLVPWELAEEIYRQSLCNDFGAPALPARLGLGALLIKERLKLTDRETVAAIQENPYLQFFIGKKQFSHVAPFDASLMVGFRKRFGEEGLAQISEKVAVAATSFAKASEDQSSPTDPTDPPASPPDEPLTVSCHSAAESDPAAVAEPSTPPDNHGQLIVDASCTPADIRYPTDVSLLNEAREKTDELIDALHAPLVGKTKRPRTYRVKARQAFVSFVSKKKPRYNAIRKAKRKQLGFLCRNLKQIDRLFDNPLSLPMTQLCHRLYRNLLVCREVYRQQQQMYETKTRRVDDRIVSLSQPHVRPIKRGKAGKDTEFGAKISISVIDGFSFLDRLSWDNYNESTDLADQIETYRQRFGYYPESVHADKIYRTRANRTLCNRLGIRMSGPPLGRRPQNISAADKKQATADEAIRNTVEGKFGQGKRRFGLGRIMAKLASTSAAQISLTFLVMNLELALRRFFLSIAFVCHHLVNLIQLTPNSPIPPTWLILHPTPQNHSQTIHKPSYYQLNTYTLLGD
jgi:IS5 family transposase